MIHEYIKCKCPECGHEETRSIVFSKQSVYMAEDGYYYTMCSKCKAKLYAKGVGRGPTNED